MSPARTPLLSSLLLAALLPATPAALADAVADWNEKAVSAVYAAGMSPDLQSRNLAIVHIAVFEAVNSIEPRYTPYRARLPAEPGTLPEAAVAAAAHATLQKLLPTQAKDLDAFLQAALARMPDSPGKASGIRLGERAAASILAEREQDGSNAPITYRPFTLPGKYVPTLFPASSTWSAVRPFVLKSGDQFRPPAPYALTSPQWAADFNEVKRMGAKTGSARTPEQNDIARFWQLTGAATYNPVTRHVVAVRNLDLLDSARLFALSAIATADTAITIFDAKYAHNFWRPVTAIRNADIDGNDATAIDPNWEPMINTPMHPEYPCAHCTFQSAAAGVLQTLYGDVVPKFTLTSTAAPGVTRSFERLSDYVTEVVNGRIYEGVHYRTSGEVGAALGRKVAEEVVKTRLQPLQSSAAAR
ncbi:vanadium-dependent haloperoxidase [Ramlibacter sp. PS3R-8]|uniref:vanadium-dependent haloperoxidase n=1 Tax=Ramlibacter sp. PS3R-8 TaxID=3133437 RepID=UPI0030A2269F